MDEKKIECAIAHFDKKVTDYQGYVDRELMNQDKQIKSHEDYLINTLDGHKKMIQEIGAGESDLIYEKSKNLFANALTGSASGKPIFITDVSPLEHELKIKLTSDTVTDFSRVTIIKGGKNFCPLSSGERNGDITVDITNVCPKGVQVTASGYIERSIENEQARLRIEYFLNGEKQYIFQEGWVTTRGHCEKTFTLPIEATAVKITAQMLGTTNGSLSVKNLQIELGEKSTEFESYVEPIMVTANADGTVEGLKSHYSTITLHTATEGITINCEYNRDINKAFEELKSLLTSNAEV